MIFTTNDRLPVQEQFNLLLDQLNMLLSGYDSDGSKVYYGNDKVMPEDYDIQIMDDDENTNVQHTGTVTLASNTDWSTVPDQSMEPITVTPGVWILTGYAAFGSTDTDGRRAIRLYNKTANEAFIRTQVNQTAVSGTATRMSVCTAVAMADKTEVALSIAQNSGSTLSVDVRIHAIKVG